MPTYEYECRKGHKFERILPVAEYRAPQTCECGADSTKLVSLPLAGYVQRECVYDSPIDGRPVTSWRQRQEDMARNGCEEYDPGIKQDYQARVKREAEQLEKKFDATIDEQIEKLPTRALEKLESELKSGVDATIERI